MKNIERVAVIGAGIMGGHLAGFFANMGIPCDMYDIDPAIFQKTLEKIADPKTKPPVLYSPRFVKEITPHLSSEFATHLKHADMIVEAVPEIMGLKHKILREVEQYRSPESIIATNTSGLSLAQMTEYLAPDTAAYFVGTHYFNPVRFLPLVEIIPCKQTKPDLIEFLKKFFQSAGKKVVLCKDTPNFIANRIGLFTMMKTLQLMEKYRFNIETIDMLTGIPMGNPKTATMRLSDMVGIDTLFEVSRNVYNNCQSDESRDIFKPPAWMEKMVAEKMLGDKTGKGFYCKDHEGVLALVPKQSEGTEVPDRQILVLDIETFQYRPQVEPKADVARVARGYDNPGERIAVMCEGETPHHRFCRELVLSSAAYSLNRIGEICDDIPTLDNAMKWGFRREIGPIEVLDTIGLTRAKKWMQDMEIPVPSLMEKIISTTGTIYKSTQAATSYFDIHCQNFKEIPRPNGISLAVLKAQNKTIKENPSARLLDLGDGVLMMELDHQMVPSINPIDDFVLGMFRYIPDIMAKGKFQALIIGNQAENFCGGAQLQTIFDLAKEKQWKKLEMASATLQIVNMALYHADFPVVMAPHNLTLGGGMEITLAGHKRVALSEFYGGLVEVGVGLLPGGAGNLLLYLQFLDMMSADNPGPMPPVARAFELIAYGTVSSSAYDAIDKGLLTRNDVVVLNKDEQILKAKEVALSMIDKHVAKPMRELYLPGPGGYLAFEGTLNELALSGKITAHGLFIAKKQAYVLTGGNNASITNPITEEDFLNLEREAFVQLCSEPKSQERIAYMLKNKRPIIN